jgi:hypothetical protein
MDSISIKKGQKIVLPLQFKKKVILNNTIDRKKLEDLAGIVKRLENVTIIKAENN